MMISGILMGMMVIVSCKKDHTCLCFDSTNELVQTNVYPNTARADAREQCADAALVLNESDTTDETYICTLDQNE